MKGARVFRIFKATAEQLAMPMLPVPVPGADLCGRSTWPPRFGARVLVDLYWTMLAPGSGRVYELEHDGSIIFHAYVVQSVRKFPFMEPGDIQIGKCYTDPAYRGRGIYPWAVREIAKRELDVEGRKAFMLVDPSNIPSLKGVAKAGFTEAGTAAVTFNLFVGKVYEPT